MVSWQRRAIQHSPCARLGQGATREVGEYWRAVGNAPEDDHVGYKKIKALHIREFQRMPHAGRVVTFPKHWTQGQRTSRSTPTEFLR
eukprot:scaffold88652_cov35-Tisochrysis_lutea.AAC.1